MSTFREPLFNFDTLTNSDTVLTWLTRTNQLITGMNSLYVADIFEGDGICTTRADGVVTINIDPGPGIGFTVDNKVKITFTDVTEVASATTISPVLNTDYFVIERSGTLRKVKADSILPPTIKHVHTFEQPVKINEYIELKPTKSPFDTNDRWTTKIGAGNTSALYYQGFNSLWYFDTNLNLGTSDSFAIVSQTIPAGTTESVFNFATHNILGTNASTDADDTLPDTISFNFNVGSAPANWDQGYVGDTTLWPATWKMKFNTSSASFYHYDPSLTEDNDEPILTMQKLGLYDNQVTINGKISISDLANSTQFISAPNGTQNKVPLTNSVGTLDKKFTNRIVTNDYSLTPQVGDLVVVSTLTDGDSQYALGVANGVGSSDVIGIVESLNGGNATIVLSGEFELNGVSSLNPGSKYYLSQTLAGKFVEEGTYSTGILKPVFVALTGSKGILISSNSALTNNISSVVVNYGDASEETLTIDSPNYPLKFVAGQNIKFDVTSNDEIEVRVEGLAGAQDTFKTIQVDGVGSTDGDGSVSANSVDDVISFKSNTIGITGNNTTKEITFEAPNSFQTFKFTNSPGTEYTCVPDSTSDTIQLVAGEGVTFTQNTNDSIIINASVQGGLSPTNFTYTGPYEIPVSSSTSSGSTVSLYGGSTGKFNAQWASVNGIDTPELNPSLAITYNSGTNVYTYNSSTYTNDISYMDTSVDDKYLPDELAGYMFGRITPSATGDNTTNPSNTISRLSRRDVRFFLGLAPYGFIDTVNNVFSRWTVDNGSNIYTAQSKNGTLNFVAGSNITLDVPNPGSPTIRISSTATPQYAFSSVIVKNSNGATIDSFDANTSSDNFTLKSGTFITIDTDTNNDTAVFDISVPYDYALLGNPGTTDGMGIIDLSSESSCFVGRANGGSIRAISPTDLSWTGSGSPRIAPTLAMPYFGLIKVVDTATNYLNASTTGQFTIAAGENVSLSVNTSTNVLTINSTGSGSTTPTPRITTVYVDAVDYTVSQFDTLKVISGNGISLTTSGIVNNTLPVTFNLAPISGNSILANTNTSVAIPSELAVDEDTVYGRLSGGNLTAVPINGSSNSIRSKLDIKYVTTLTYQNFGSSATSIANSTIDGTTINLFAIDSTISFTSAGSYGIGIRAITNLSTDTDATFASTGIGPTNVGITTVKYGNKSTSFNTRKLLTQTLQNVGDGDQTNHTLAKEYYIPSVSLGTSNVNLVTGLTSVGGKTSQSYLANNAVGEYLYSTDYTLAVKDWDGSNWVAGDFTLSGDVLTLSGSNDIALTGSGKYLNLGSKYLKSTGDVFRLWTSGSSLTIAGYSGSSTVPSTNISLSSADLITMYLKSDETSYIAFNKDSGTNTDQRITSSGTLIFDAGVTFESGQTVTFTGATVVGLSTSVHSSTHQSTQDESSDGGGIGATDEILAWQVGAVARMSPVLLNKIAIANGDGAFDYTVPYTQQQLYGQSGGAASTYSTIFGSVSDTTAGPMYVVLASGEETNLTSTENKGPAGQIIMIRKT